MTLYQEVSMLVVHTTGHVMSTELEFMVSSTAIKQANRLIESVYRMEVNEHKLILMATKKVHQMEVNNKPFTPDTEIVITAAEFANEYGITRQSAFEIIQEAKNTIYDRSFDYVVETPDGSIKYMSSRWIHAKGETKGKSEISMFFAPKVIPFIYLVEREFTLLDLREVGRLKSKYAIRLYKLLMKWRNAKYQPSFDYQDLRQKLGLDAGEYSAMCDFKKRVIKIAVDQINKGTGFVGLKVIEKKTGRNITGFSFTYTKYDNDTLNITPMEQKQAKKAVESKKPYQGTQEEENTHTGENTANDDNPVKQKTKRYFADGMTEPQAYMFANKIVDKIMKNEGQFMYLSSLATEGMSQHEFINQIAEDFMVGRLEPYAKALEILKYKHAPEK